jgi:hypothetical protein
MSALRSSGLRTTPERSGTNVEERLAPIAGVCKWDVRICM